jgi:hypothetical protein
MPISFGFRPRILEDLSIASEALQLDQSLKRIKWVPAAVVKAGYIDAFEIYIQRHKRTGTDWLAA